ncbi:hypothetical protein JAAARDRAFT_60293 [Jaapia argillacea MUCL 33604]|uniref:Uncharacterized protein n=1 Tax=Jaapia argillacea MUCL 33604 TaxID=933084 RepID=A0A067PWW9_9AGAM|nr:hypothetical protein JAAARDRAFT_60293 [Jaapia argillacea MUCL 33604]
MFSLRRLSFSSKRSRRDSTLSTSTSSSSQMTSDPSSVYAASLPPSYSSITLPISVSSSESSSIAELLEDDNMAWGRTAAPVKQKKRSRRT